MSKAEQNAARALEYIRKYPGARASDIGWHLWGESTEAPGRGVGSHGQNKFCRAAGKLLRGLELGGFVQWKPEKKHVGWYVRRCGR